MCADFVQFRRNGYGNRVDQIFPVAFRPPRCVSTITGLPPRPDAPRDAARIAFECGFDGERNCQVEAAGSNGNGSTNLCLLFASQETEINSLQLSSTARETRRSVVESDLDQPVQFAPDPKTSVEMQMIRGPPVEHLLGYLGAAAFIPLVESQLIPNILICFLYLHYVIFF